MKKGLNLNFSSIGGKEDFSMRGASPWEKLGETTESTLGEIFYLTKRETLLRLKNGFDGQHVLGMIGSIDKTCLISLPSEKVVEPRDLIVIKSYRVLKVS